VGEVTQSFEGMRDLDAMGFARRGVFTNAAQFGPLRTALRARCEAKSDRRCAAPPGRARAERRVRFLVW
jgi:hypothetical protein